jgi:small subunit ribosomal protein S5
MECAGIDDILTKSMGSANPVNIVKAVMKAFSLLDTPEAVAARRGVPLEKVIYRDTVARKNLNTKKPATATETKEENVSVEDSKNASTDSAAEAEKRESAKSAVSAS